MPRFDFGSLHAFYHLAVFESLTLFRENVTDGDIPVHRGSSNFAGLNILHIEDLTGLRVLDNFPLFVHDKFGADS